MLPVGPEEPVPRVAVPPVVELPVWPVDVVPVPPAEPWAAEVPVWAADGSLAVPAAACPHAARARHRAAMAGQRNQPALALGVKLIRLG